jgi:hypothetical protein
VNELSLNTLAIEINCLNEQVEHHKNQAVAYAARTGEKLLLAKAQCSHGEFGDWLKANCTLSQSYANSFMRLAIDMPELSNLHSSVNLGLKQAIALLSAPEEVKTAVLEKIESGEKITVAQINQLKKENTGLSLKNVGLENEAAELYRQLVEADKHIEAEAPRIQRAAEELSKKSLIQAQENLKLFEAASEQNHKLIKIGRAEVDNYKLAIKKLKAEHAEALAKAEQDGEQSAVNAKAAELAEIERRLKMTTDHLATVKVELDRASTAINLQTCSDRVAKSVYDNMLSISVKFGEFSLELNQEQHDAASESMIETWQKIVKQFELGVKEAQKIVEDLQTKKVKLLKVI